MTHALSAAGSFHLAQWAAHFGGRSEQAQAAGGPTMASGLLRVWLRGGLETFLMNPVSADPARLEGIAAAWTKAYLNDSHGAPV